MKSNIYTDLLQFNKHFQGEIKTDELSKIIYATDASAYREKPLAVAWPKTENDIVGLIQFARKHKVSLIPRTAGTSLAGQVVGKGIVVDVSKHFTNIIELNTTEQWVKVQPGVILDELNRYLKPHGLFFGPETSTANRCMIGGMVGNNACGAHSLVYGSTRDHVLELKTLLSDGSVAVFNSLDNNAFLQKLQLSNTEGQIYRDTLKILSNDNVRANIEKEFPDKRLKRRNTGYAIDVLTNSSPFFNPLLPFNFCNLLAGSEGTLAFTTEIKLHLVPLPPQYKALLCVHCNSLEEALVTNIELLKHKPVAIELMDKTILNCTKNNIEQRKNRFFIEGNPEAVLITEFALHNQNALSDACTQTIEALKSKGFGYAYPIIKGDDIIKVWQLRKAGLGVLSNIPGDAKPVSVIEDTAVHPDYLPAYIADFKAILSRHELQCVFHAHIATGELHLRPVLNLKLTADVQKFRIIATEIAHLVKKYRGSLSGEHGDGRLRGEFIPIMIGQYNYSLLKAIKRIWDPENIFNPGKIVDTPPMDKWLRYSPDIKIKQFDSAFYYPEGSVLSLAEKCNGSGDCRKTALIGGGMCPSYQASLDEDKTTRARANILREFLSKSSKNNVFNHVEIKQVMDLCLSCKACKSECPSGVDVAKLKAEFLHQYYKSNRIPIRTLLIANIARINSVLTYTWWIINAMYKNRLSSLAIKKISGFARQRSLPVLSSQNLRRWLSKQNSTTNSKATKTVYLFVDEFTNYNEAELGKKCIGLLEKLNYQVKTIAHPESGRAYISKGLLTKAKALATKNVLAFQSIITTETPLIGIEPSCILSFRDEYPDLVDHTMRPAAITLSRNVFTIEEFLHHEIMHNNISKNAFTTDEKEILYHGHCQQKAIASVQQALSILSLPENYHATLIDAGCCGMAGSFGYEKEHYELSMKVGELKLFPAVRLATTQTIIAASGTSCRHQIIDGTQRQALHPVEVLYEALR